MDSNTVISLRWLGINERSCVGICWKMDSHLSNKKIKMQKTMKLNKNSVSEYKWEVWVKRPNFLISNKKINLFHWKGLYVNWKNKNRSLTLHTENYHFMGGGGGM